MAITATHLLAGGDTTNALATYTSASISPATDGTPVIAYVIVTRGTASAPTVSSIAGMGLTWTLTKRSTQFNDGTNWIRIEQWQGVGSASAGTVVFTMSASTATSVGWSFDQFPGAHTTTPITIANTVETGSGTAAVSGTATLPNALAGGSGVIGAFAHMAQEDITAGVGFTKASTFDSHAGPTTGMTSEWKLSPADGVVDASWVTSAQWVMVGAEIAAAPAAATHGELGLLGVG